MPEADKRLEYSDWGVICGCGLIVSRGSLEEGPSFIPIRVSSAYFKHLTTAVPALEATHIAIPNPSKQNAQIREHMIFFLPQRISTGRNDWFSEKMSKDPQVGSEIRVQRFDEFCKEYKREHLSHLADPKTRLGIFASPEDVDINLFFEVIARYLIDETLY